MRSMRIVRNKKGVVFTILAIVIAIFFTLIFSARLEKPLDYKTDVIETRITVLNQYMENFYDYAQSAAEVAGYSALQGILSDMNTIHHYYNLSLNQFETNYTYCLLEGNLTKSKNCSGMTNKTLRYYLNKIQNLSNKELNINSNYTVYNITINQTTDAFAIDIIFNLSFEINDAYANLSDSRIITSSISIQGLLDPLYMLNGTYNRTINKTTLNKKEGDWNYTDLQQLYYGRQYRRYENGISFINRIKGNFSPSKFGIESFVNYTDPRVISDPLNRFNENSTMVDYLFWRNITFKCRNNATVVEINNTAIILPLGFQLDEVHRTGFNISNSDTNFTCIQ